jgi:hypothetical protein
MPKPAIAFAEALPQGLKPLIYGIFYGTAKAVPFRENPQGEP